MIENTALELGDFAEDAPRNAALTELVLPRGDDLDPQQVALAGVKICRSGHDIHCGLSVMPADGVPETIAATDDVPVRLDWLQRELRQGPFLGADPGGTLVIKDLAADQRWPDFGRMCVAVMNMRSMVSVRIPVARPNRARLSLYSSEPGAFDHLDLGAASRLAALAAPTVTILINEFGEPLLHAAPSDCSKVAIALGTVIARYRVNSADAFDLLCEASHDLNRALLGVAIGVVADGGLPEEALVHARRYRTPRRRRSQAVELAAVTPPRAYWQPSGRHVPPRRSAGQPSGAHAAASIGGPEMWRDPLAANR
jgi:hypothetical protein